jgi:release factor glutamine methyltransferase
MKKKDDTPGTVHYHDLVIESHPEVYNPAEDSFLLLETLHIDSNDTVLELGTGCGLIALDCARKGAHIVCTDINPFAVQLTRRNIERNRHLLKGTIDIRQGNLFSALHQKELFDVIIFNPPYLPTKKQEKVGGWFDVATDGGLDGLSVTKRFIHGLKKHLVKNGSAYFIFSSLSEQPKLESYLKYEGFSSEIVARHRFEDEDLFVYHVTPTD